MSPSQNPRSSDQKPRSHDWGSSQDILSEKLFHRMIALEQKRSERTQRPFALLLMDAGRSLAIGKSTEPENSGMLLNLLSRIQADTRETDLMGWYQTNVAVGVMFTEIMADNTLILNAILSRINSTLRKKLTAEQFNQIKFSCQLFPEELGRLNPVSEKTVGLPMIYPAGGSPSGTGSIRG